MAGGDQAVANAKLARQEDRIYFEVHMPSISFSLHDFLEYLKRPETAAHLNREDVTELHRIIIEIQEGNQTWSQKPPRPTRKSRLLVQLINCFLNGGVPITDVSIKIQASGTDYE